ncbi:hypothetical protein O3M35_000600 [Rhynocoris fuscipes]|uniref:ERAP1-like C-terminal domain-containing protein n=1 Tax=Rhynocoris fuscipes TaxID=488301 RepID=A0AAW1DPA9_9HEMI
MLFIQIRDWGDPNDYINHDIQETVLISNARPNSRPVVDNTLKTEHDVLDFIRGPAMLKGAGILSMLETVLSKEILLDVIMDYFSDTISSGKDTMSTDDFVNYLASDNEVVAKLHRQLDMRDVMNTWLYQPGYPYLQTQRAGGGITIRQNVFVSQMPAVKKIVPWKFPIFYTTERNPDFDNDRNYFWLLSNDNRSVALNFTAPQSEWIIMNVNGSGLYRVNYEDRDWINLAYAMNEDATVFPSSTRAKLVSDAFAMLYSGHTNFSIVTSFLSYLRKEDSLTPWLTALESLQYLNSLLYKTNLKDELDNYVVTILADAYKKLGVEGDSVDNAQKTLRQKVVSTMCKHGYAACLTDTAAVFKKMNEEGYRVDNDVRPVVICNGIRQYNKDKWMEQFNATFDDMLTLGQADKQAYFEAMACNQNADVMEKYLDILFNTQIIAKDDMMIAFKAIYTNPEHTNRALNDFVTGEQDFRKDITLEDKVNMMNSIAPYLTTDDDFDLLKDFLSHVTPPQVLKDATLQAMKNINYTKDFLNKNHEELKRAFKIVDGPTTPSTAPPVTKVTPSPQPDTTTTPPPGTGTGGPSTSTTHKPGAASSVSIFSVVTLMLFTVAVQIIH